jgi:hypothetical protein
MDERGLAAAADAGDAAEEVEGDFDIDAAEVVGRRTPVREEFSRPGSRRTARDGDGESGRRDIFR